MITINLRDHNFIENFKAIQIVRATGLFSDEQIQEMYDRQLENDAKAREKTED